MKKYLIVYLIFIPQFLFAQSLTLGQYRERVLEYNQEIKQARESVKSALYSLKSIRTGFFPHLDATGSYSYQLERIEFMPETPLKHDNYNAEANLVQNVYAGGTVRRQYEAAKIEQAIAGLDEKYTMDNVIYAADINYWTASANRERLVIAHGFIDIVKGLSDVVYKRFAEGAISRTDVLMVQSRSKEADLHLNTEEMNYKIAMQALKIMMGVDIETDVMVADSIQTLSAIPFQQNLQTALDNRADYQVTLKNIELAELQTRLTRANYMPRLTAGIKEKWGTPLLNVDGDRQFSTVLFANLDIPVFHWGERRQSVRISGTREEIQKLEKSKLQDQVNRELNAAWINLSETLKRIQIVNTSLEIAHDNLRLNTFSYNEGKLPILDVLSAQVTWLQAYTNVVSVNYQYKIALAEYVKALGGESLAGEME